MHSMTIGIEIAKGGHPAGLPAYPPAQLAALVAHSRDIVGRLAIQPQRVDGIADASTITTLRDLTASLPGPATA